MRLAAGLGADVPAQVRPGRVLATGAGEEVRPLPAGPPLGLLVLPAPEPLSTAAVYREADRLGLARDADDLAARRAAVEDALRDCADLPAGLLVNDLEPAARALAPAIDAARAEATGAGADHVMVAGSGPTVVGLFAGVDGPERARRAAARLARRLPAALACEAVGEP
jgi:4-diphosphocytidyl-2-C-methyl-D-erythritol kinase